MNKILIAGGSGFIGQHLCSHWKDKEIAIISRKKISGVQSYTWDEIKTNGVAICQNYSVIINLTGENISAGRWTEARKTAILKSRMDSTELLRSICEQLAERSPVLFNASAIGVYDLQDVDHTAYTETTQIDFNVMSSFLAQVARAWEKATWSNSITKPRTINLRFGVVLAKNGGALKKMARPFYFGLGGTVGSGQQMFSWVHIDDLIAAIEFIYSHPELNGPINIVAPEAISQAIFAKTLANILHRPALLKTPAWILKLLFGQMAEELLLKGQRVYPAKLIEAGFQFRHPRLVDALSATFR